MKRNEMSIIYSRNHSVTFGVACVVVSVVMLLFLLHKTHEQLEVTRGDLGKVNDKFLSLSRQFDSLYEYKERLENSFVDLKEKKSAMTSKSDSLKSELSVLKQSHRTEMQRLQDELDVCRRHEEMAGVRNQPQRDEALSPQILPNDPNNNHHGDTTGGGAGDKLQIGEAGSNNIKVISSLSKSGMHLQQPQVAGGGNVINFIRGGGGGGGVDPKDNGIHPAPATQFPPGGNIVQPSMDPNQDPVGNVFI